MKILQAVEIVTAADKYQVSPYRVIHSDSAMGGIFSFVDVEAFMIML